MDIKNKITEMGSKLKEVEGKLAQRSMPKVELLRKPSKSDSHFNIHDKGPTQMYKPGGYSESIGERPPRMVFHTSIIPETTLKNTDPLRASRITSSAEVDKVIRSIRTEIENWKKKKLNFQGKLNFDEEITSDMPAADIREEAERDAERAVSTAPSKCQTDSCQSEASCSLPKFRSVSRPSSENPVSFSRHIDVVSRNSSSSTGEKFSHHSHYPLDKYLSKDVLADLPQINDLALGENRTKQHELFGTLSILTKELERLKGPVLRRSVSDITTNSIGDSESCYTEELVETQFRKATYAFRKKNPHDVHRKKSHFTIVNQHSDRTTKVHLSKENDNFRSPYQREAMLTGYSSPSPPLLRSAEMPSTSYQNFDMRTQTYERPQQYTPRYDEKDYNRDSRQYRTCRSPVSPVPMTPGYDNYYSTTAQPGTATSQAHNYPMWSANSNGYPVSQENSVATPYRPDSYNRHRMHRHTPHEAGYHENVPRIRSPAVRQEPQRQSPRANLSFKTEQILIPPVPCGKMTSQMFNELRTPSNNMHSQLNSKPVQDVCVNTDFINSSVYSFKSKFDIVEKEEVKPSNKTFGVQQLPKLSIRPQLVTQVGPNVNIWPHRVSKSKNNVGVFELVHPPASQEQKSEDKTNKIQNFQPKTVPNCPRTNKKRDILTEEKPEESTPKQKDEPKLLRVAEQFCNTLSVKKQQEFVELKTSMQNLLACVNDLYENQLYTMEELQKASLGSNHNSEDLPRRMNMVADLLEDEIGKFGTQNKDHYERLGRVMNVLVDDIQTTLNAVDGQRNIIRSQQTDSKEIPKTSANTGRTQLRRGSSQAGLTTFNEEEKRTLRSYEGDLKSNDYKTQKNLELRLSRIEKLFEINKSLKEIIAETSPDTTETYDSTPQEDTTSYDLDASKSELSMDKSFSEKLVEEKLNETFIVDEENKKVGTGDPDEEYLKELKTKADNILDVFLKKPKGIKLERELHDNQRQIFTLPSVPQALPISPKQPNKDIFKEIERLTVELSLCNKRDVQVETDPNELCAIALQNAELKDKIDSPSLFALTKPKETQTDPIIDLITEQTSVFPEQPVTGSSCVKEMVEPVVKQSVQAVIEPEPSTSAQNPAKIVALLQKLPEFLQSTAQADAARTCQSLPEFPLAIRPFLKEEETHSLPPSRLSPSPPPLIPEMQIIKQSEEAADLLNSTVQPSALQKLECMPPQSISNVDKSMPFLRFSNPQTNSLLEVRFPEEHKKFTSSFILQSNSQGDDIKLSYNREDHELENQNNLKPIEYEVKKEELKEDIFPQVVCQTDDLSKLDENMQVTGSVNAEKIELKPCSSISVVTIPTSDDSSKMSKKFTDEPTEKASQGVHEARQVHDEASEAIYREMGSEQLLDSLSSNLLKLLEVRINEVVSMHSESTKVTSSKKKSSQTDFRDLDELSLSELEKLQHLETNTTRKIIKPAISSQSDTDSAKTEPSPRLLPIPPISVPYKVVKNAIIQVDTYTDKNPEEKQKFTFPRFLRPCPSFCNEAEDIQSIKKKVRKDLLGETITKVRSLDSVKDHPMTTSPLMSRLQKKPPPLHLKLGTSGESIQIEYWDSDQMSEGEIGYIFTSNSYSSGEIKPRPLKPKDQNEEKSSRASCSFLTDEEFIAGLRQFQDENLPDQTSPVESENSKESSVYNESETTPETTTSETPSTSDTSDSEYN
ncbi:uncharacterized protein LOC106670168 isoform X2 [Cimex lectularius]|nr:uncharacterized protein LOC106670168 isoform X2 [Cimex lectularius]XP_014255741.1 uncharacterized protein LOC106670168 isoform X2 [Cimex lectularius]